MFYVKERVQKICGQLLALSRPDTVSLEGWDWKPGFFVTPDQAHSDKGVWTHFDAARDCWMGNDEYFWFTAQVQVPQAMEGKTLWLSLTQSQGGWDAVINPQFLVFVNGEVAQGADLNHQEVRIAQQAVGGSTITIDLQAYTGRRPDAQTGALKRLTLEAALFTPRQDVLDLYYDLLVPSQVLSRLEAQSHEAIALERVLTQAVNLIDLRKPYSEAFDISINHALAFLKEELYTKLAGNEQVIATCIGHTHIDVAWLWTVEQTRQKAARSFSTVLQMMDEYPEYQFMSSQPQLYQFIKLRYPDLYEKIAQRIRDGRWEPEGGMWLEADCNVTSGESLVRQFLHGKRFFKEEFGVDNRILWLPDVFGYSAALPQIMKKSGIDYFMTTKIAWNQFNQLPYDTFWWRGIDGSEVFTHMITMQNTDQVEDSFFTTYNGVVDGISVMRAWERYQQKPINNDVLIAFGHGDGGGGPTREMLEYMRRLSTGLPGAPKTRIAPAREYFDQLRDKLAVQPKTPRWTGELYFEYHRGTYTSMARNKRDNRKCELLFQDAEFFSVWAQRFGLAYPAQKLDACWKNILLNQFHDILPGTSIEDVYEATKAEYQQLLSDGHHLVEEALGVLTQQLAADAGDVTVFNSLSFSRSDLLLLDTGAQGYTDEDGAPCASQPTHDGKLLVLVPQVPQKGVRVLKPAAQSAVQASPFVITQNGIETPLLSLEFDQHWQFSRIYDKRAQREVLKPGAKGNALVSFEDKPMNYDNWDIDIYYTEKRWPVEDVQSAQWIENGPVRAVLRIRRNLVDSVIDQHICFYTHTARIDFETKVDWKQSQLLLKVDFPVDIHADEATYEIQFGNVKRPTHTNTSWDVARFETCGQKWADLSEEGYGVSLLNDCKYGHAINQHAMQLTLIKSGIEPNPHSDQELHVFTYSLYPHLGDWKQADTAAQAYALNVPLYAAQKHADDVAPTLKGQNSFLTVQGDHVVLETIKQAEDGNGMIVRLYEYKNRRAPVSITLGGVPASVQECSLMEEAEREIPVNGNSITLEMLPYEIKTLRIVNA